MLQEICSALFSSSPPLHLSYVLELLTVRTVRRALPIHTLSCIIFDSSRHSRLQRGDVGLLVNSLSVNLHVNKINSLAYLTQTSHQQSFIMPIYDGHPRVVWPRYRLVSTQWIFDFATRPSPVKIHYLELRLCVALFVTYHDIVRPQIPMDDPALLITSSNLST